MEQTTTIVSSVIAPAELLKHWQGHRNLTRRTMEVFPEKEFFEFSIGGMRPYVALIMELLAIAEPGLREIVSSQTSHLNEHFEHGNQKANLLAAWDKATVAIDELFAQLTEERFHDEVNLFGQYKGTVWSSIFYFIDNEIHHRGQGYVYLRALGIEPPFFWDRP